ncbi:hypothetical protein BBP40_010521 [Aspergillus hancockii]|nr:hypothetical protein BBP40_010521 [Aspergillus hancockii]
MEDLLCQKAKTSPDATAVIDGKLISWVNNYVKSHSTSKSQFCIFLESGLNQIIAQVAVLRVGGSCVPIEPSVLDIRLAGMLHDISSRYVITSKALTHRVSEFEVILVDIVNEGDVHMVKNGTTSVLAGCSESHRSHILFTSGSTGKPKAVQVSARSILHLVISAPVTPLTSMDRTSSFINPGFDLSLFEIWVTLLSGATITVLPKEVVTDPFALGKYLHEWKITVVIIPTALFNITCLHSPSNLRHVRVIGEAANVNIMQNVLTDGAPQNLWNAYGPAETTTFSSLQLVSVDEINA